MADNYHRFCCLLCLEPQNKPLGVWWKPIRLGKSTMTQPTVCTDGDSPQLPTAILI